MTARGALGAMVLLAAGPLTFGPPWFSSHRFGPPWEDRPATEATYTLANTRTAFEAYQRAFYVVKKGKGYHREKTSGGRNAFWTQAEEIELLLDTYERTQSARHRRLIVQSIDGFVDEFGPNWLTNKFNDDLLWMVIACARAFQVTHETRFRDLAKLHFDETYARAWSSDLGGGLWWTTDNGTKNACVNGPGAIAASYLFEILDEAEYLEKARAIYAWERERLFVEETGAVLDHLRADGRLERHVWTYNTGTFIGAAHRLSQLCAEPAYLADAEKAVVYTRDKLCKDGLFPKYGSDGDAAGFSSIFYRWFARYAGENGLWPKYHGWMLQNANAAWEARRRDGLCWNRWPEATPEDLDLRAWDCTDAVTIWQVVPRELP